MFFVALSVHYVYHTLILFHYKTISVNVITVKHKISPHKTIS